MQKFIIFCAIIAACYAATSQVTDSTIIARKKRCELHHGQRKVIEEQTGSTGGHRNESNQTHSPLEVVVEEKKQVNKVEVVHQHGHEINENAQVMHHEHDNKQLPNEQEMEHLEHQHEHEEHSHNHEHSDNEHSHEGHSHVQNDQLNNQEKVQVKVEKQDVPKSEKEKENKDSISDSVVVESTPTMLEDSTLRRKPIPVSELFSRTKATQSDRT